MRPNCELRRCAPGRGRAAVRAWLWAAVAVGAAVRVYLALSASVIARDGVVYVTMARRMVTDWRAELANPYPLGFPFLIRWVHAAVGGLLGAEPVLQWQRSGQLVSVMFGAASIVLVFALGRRLLGARCGLLAAWIWALLPHAAALSADALTDVPTVTLMLAAVLAIMRGAEGGGIAWWMFAGLLSGAASTMRPEGGEILLVGLGVLLVVGGERSGARGLRGRGWAAAGLVAGFAVVGGSYILLEGGRILHKQGWMGEQSAAGVGAIVILAGAEGASILKGLMMLIEKLFASLNGVWMVVGSAYVLLAGRRRMRRKDALTVRTWWSLHAAVLVWFAMRAGYLSSRHCLALDVMFVVFSAGVLGWARGRVRMRVGLDVAAVVVIGAALLPWLLRDINQERGYVREAGRWIAETSGGPPPGIVAVDGWAPFYAGAVQWANCKTAGELSNCAELGDATWLVLPPGEKPPPMVTIPSIGRSMVISEAARFVEPGGKRGLVIYLVKRG